MGGCPLFVLPGTRANIEMPGKGKWVANKMRPRGGGAEAEGGKKRERNYRLKER